MPVKKKIPRFSPKQPLSVSTEGQDTSNLVLPELLEEDSSSCSSPTPSNGDKATEKTSLKETAAEETSAVEKPSTSQSLQSEHEVSSSTEDTEEGSSDDDSDGLTPLDVEKLSGSPIREKASLLARYLLLKYRIKEPVTLEDMLNTVIKEYKDHFPEILQKAQECLEMLFGLEVLEVDTIHHCYTVCMTLGLTYDGLLREVEGMPKTGILIIVLGVIFLNRNSATEKQVWEVMNTMGIYAGQKHFICGKPEDFLTGELVQQKYVEYRQLPNTNPPRYKFVWGPRAFAEVNKLQLLQFLLKAYARSPGSFPITFVVALKVEKERAQGLAAASVDASATTVSLESSGATSSSCFQPQ
ncbi:melanoma-associated antigen B16-like [Echinops telfairi]|uniref:Melanoma-associated antigen B16-like n=1 Tax=Echinops telfairi TaxID=9371 RepID=A0ABM0ZU40_ECHTE|nr:melanoma-associated antigen B16-like [Echinops telfairi]